MKSLTTGVLSFASTYPATHPAAIAGFNDVIGAATKAVNQVSGCALAIIVPIADNVPLIINHHFNAFKPCSRLPLSHRPF